MERGRDAAAGMMLAAATLLRLFPLLLVFYLVLRRRWRVLAWTIAGITIGILITVAIAGVATSRSFFPSISLLRSQTWLSSNSNISLEAFISRTFWDLFGTSGASLDLARRICVRAADLMVLCFVIKATTFDSGEDRNWRVLCLWIVAAVMLSPTAWFHYLLLMLIVFAQMASAARRGWVSDRSLGMAVGSYLVAGAIGVVLLTAAPESKVFDVTRQFEFLCLLMVFVAAYWFAADRPRLLTRSDSSDFTAEAE
jgi:Glycosyltransferase family 87